MRDVCTLGGIFLWRVYIICTQGINLLEKVAHTSWIYQNFAAPYGGAYCDRLKGGMRYENVFARAQLVKISTFLYVCMCFEL